MVGMTAQLPVFPAVDGQAVTAPVVQIGPVVALVQDGDGGRVFLRGDLVYAWDDGDVAGRRWAAVQLARTKAAPLVAVAAGFGVDPLTVRRWRQSMDCDGVAGLVPNKRGPKGPSRLTPEVVARIRAGSADGMSMAALARAEQVAPNSVRRALAPKPADEDATALQPDPQLAPEAVDTPDVDVPAGVTSGAGAPGGSMAGSASQGAAVAGAVVPVLPPPADRSAERCAARFGEIECAPPVFAAAGRVPLAGLFTAFPALAATGLLEAAKKVFGGLPAGFYGLDTMLIEGVLRALAGAARAEAAGTIDPYALGRVLGLDRAPEVKTIRRRLKMLADTGKAPELLAVMAEHHLRADPARAAVLYVDGHVRTYAGTRRVGKTHVARLKFPAPATVETWVCDGAGDPVLVVMAEPGAALAGELRRLLPVMRQAIGDDRRVLVGFDRGGWSPALFADMHAAGFDVLTWRKGTTADIHPDLFDDVTFTDPDTGVEHTWAAADTTVALPIGDSGRTFTMRQVTKIAADGHQAHLLTTRTDLSPGEVIWRMGARWRQENYFRYARIRFDLDSHDSYAATADDPDRKVPNPAKKTAHTRVLAARTRHARVQAATDAAMLAATTPPPGTTILFTNAEYNTINADLRAAEKALDAAEQAHWDTPARVRLGDLHPDQQVLDTNTKLVHHIIRITAFNIATALARTITTDTGYAKARTEAHTLVRAILAATGDIEPGPDTLTITLDPLPTPRATAALTELCAHLTATKTCYPGTDLTLHYRVKTGT